jgi:hypothetical protein
MSAPAQQRTEDTATSASRLLPMLLGGERLATLRAPRVLDFGRANADSFAFFGDYACHLRILDAADGLQGLHKPPGDNEDPPRPATAETFRRLFPELAGERFDLILLWDSLNLLPRRDLEGFFVFLREHLHDGCRGHGFMLHKPGAEPQLRFFGICSEGTLRLVGEEPASLYLHSRKVMSEAMAPLVIEHAVLRGDGRQEFLFR